MAAALGMRDKMYAEIERHPERLTVSRFLRICQRLSVSPRFLLQLWREADLLLLVPHGRQLVRILAPLEPHRRLRVLAQLAELFDGQNPRMPRPKSTAAKAQLPETVHAFAHPHRMDPPAPAPRALMKAR
jgi:hypothetical protein